MLVSDQDHTHARRRLADRDCLAGLKVRICLARLLSLGEHVRLGELVRLGGVVRLCCLLALLCAFGTAPAFAQSPRLIVVFDGSGSMWGRIEGAKLSKHALMRQALDDQMRAELGSAAIGLTLFGARPAGSCAVATTVVPPVPGQIDQVSTALAKLNPQGRGPVVLGLRTALKSLNGDARPAHLLVIHDGLDNCGQDVCELARTLSGAKMRVAVSAISLALKPGQRGAMSCLTIATGGMLVEAQTADEAVDGLKQIVAIIAGSANPSATRLTTPRAPKAPPTTALKRPLPKTTGLTLRAKLDTSDDAITDGITWRVRRVGKPAYQRWFAKPTVNVAVPSGRYQVTMNGVTARIEREVIVKEGARQTELFTFKGGVVHVAAGAGAQRASEMIITVARRGSDASGGGDTTIWAGPALAARSLLLPAGAYHISASNGLGAHGVPVDVVRGRSQRARLGVRNARLSLNVTGLRPAQLAEASLSVVVDDPANPDNQRVVARSAAPTASFDLPPGPYKVILKVLDAQASAVVVLAAGQTTSHTLGLSQMSLRISTHVGKAREHVKQNLRYRLWRSDALDRPIAVSRRAQPIFNLAPGKYRIESRIGLQNAVMIREFDVGASPFGSLELRHNAGRVELVAPDATSVLTKHVYWQVHDQDGQLIWRSFERSPSVVLGAGTYRATVDVDSVRHRTTFAVVAGYPQRVVAGQ